MAIPAPLLNEQNHKSLMSADRFWTLNLYVTLLICHDIKFKKNPVFKIILWAIRWATFGLWPTTCAESTADTHDDNRGGSLMAPLWMLLLLQFLSRASSFHVRALD